MRKILISIAMLTSIVVSAQLLKEVSVEKENLSAGVSAANLYSKATAKTVFLENEDNTISTEVYENYPDYTAGKTGYNLFPSYEVKSTEVDLLAEQLVDKTVRRQIIRDDKLYVLALDAANEPYIYFADLTTGTVTELDKAAVVMGGNGRLKISDIALTADHVLVACGFSKNHMGDEYMDEGEERGSVNFYKWSQNEETGTPETCELWFTTDYSCGYFRGLLGKTMAYSGTINEGTITVTCPHGTYTQNIGMRFAQFSIVEGQNTGVIRYDAWVAAPNETNFYADALSNCDDYEMMVSPLGNNNFILDGNLIAPFEWSAEGEASEPQVLGRNEKIAVKANGANYFKYASKTLMVAPDVNEEGKVAGLKLFDITKGLSDAVEIVLDGATLAEPVEYTYASAHGELALTLDDLTGDITDAKIGLFLVVDGKVTKYTETETYTTYNPEEGGTANPFAYALSSEVVEKTLKVKYSLNTAAKAVNVNVKDAEGKVVATVAGATVAGAQSVEIALADLVDGEYTWEVEVEGEEKTSVETFKSYMFFHPRGVDVDNNMESPSFGNIYVTEGMTSSLEQYHSNTTTSGGLGLYAFTADMEPILNPATGKYGFNGGWALNYKIGSSNAADLARVRVAEDGRLFVTRMSEEGNYIMYAPSFDDLVANNKFTSLFDGLTLDAATYKYTNSEGTFMGAANLGFDIKGSGEDLKMIALSSNANHWSYVYSGASTDEYALGTATELPVPTNVPALTGKYTLAPVTTNVEYDDRGGIWYCQYRGTPTEANPGLVYIDATGEEKYKDLVSRGGGGVRVSPDGKQIAVASSSANPKQFTVYNLVWSEDGVPALRREYVITHNIGTCVNDIAWDLAGNIYICGHSGEYLKGFSLPRTKPFVTKAASKYSFRINNELDCGVYAYDLTSEVIENTATISFKLNNKSHNVSLVLTPVEEGGEDVVYEMGALAAGVNTYEVDLAALATGDYKWSVSVANKKIDSGDILATLNTWGAGSSFYRGGVAVETNPESEYFATTYLGVGRSIGVFLLDPMCQVKDNAPYWVGSFNTSNAASTFRSALYNDKLYLTDWSDDYPGIWIFDPANPTAINNIFAGATNDGTGKLTIDGVAVGGGSTGVAFTGEGADRKMFIYVEDLPTGNGGNKLYRYDIGAEDIWGAKEPVQLETASGKLVKTNTGMLGSALHNVVFCSQTRNANQNDESIPSFIVIDEDGNIVFNGGDLSETLDGCLGGGMALSADETKFAIIDGSAAIQVYDVEWNENVPSFTHVASIPTKDDEICQMSFDYAGNLHCINRRHGYYVHAVPCDEREVVTPAKDAFVLKGMDTSVAIEDVEAEDANAPVEYYNLQGMKVVNPEKGIFIKKQGGKTTKVVL